MIFKSIRSRLALSFAGIALVAALALGVVLLPILRDYYSNQELTYLHGNARSISTVIAAILSVHAPPDEVQSQVENLSFLTQTRIRVYDINGQLLYDSGSPQNVNVNLGVAKQTLIQTNDAPPKDMVFMSIGDSQSAPAPSPEELGSKRVFVYHSVQAGGSAYGFELKLPGEVSPVTARSNLRIMTMMLDPISNNKIGAVELSEGPAYGSAILASVARGWALASTFAVLLAAAIGWYISRRISAPILALTDVTTRMAQGELSGRAEISGRDEFGQLARSFNEMAGRIEDTVSTLRAFVADAAHELNSPLTALQTNLEMARDEKNASARTRYLSRAQEQSQRLEAMVRSLLDLSRLEAGRSSSESVALDFTQLVRAACEQFASCAEQAERTFSMTLSDSALFVLGDETQLRQVLTNLLENALKFTPKDGSISLTLEQADNEVRLTVMDTGVGIPPDDLPHLFERFHRGRNVSEYNGNGLGLAIVKAIVELHHGRVQADSAGLHQGSTFTIMLPLA